MENELLNDAEEIEENETLNEETEENTEEENTTTQVDYSASLEEIIASQEALIANQEAIILQNTDIITELQLVNNGLRGLNSLAMLSIICIVAVFIASRIFMKFF